MTEKLLPQQTPKIKKSQQSLAQIEEQIEALQNKKKRLESQQAGRLMKACQKILGEDYSEELVLKILGATQQEMQNSPEKKEAWMKTSLPFQEGSLQHKKGATR